MGGAANTGKNSGGNEEKKSRQTVTMMPKCQCVPFWRAYATEKIQRAMQGLSQRVRPPVFLLKKAMYGIRSPLLPNKALSMSPTG